MYKISHSDKLLIKKKSNKHCESFTLAPDCIFCFSFFVFKSFLFYYNTLPLSITFTLCLRKGWITYTNMFLLQLYLKMGGKRTCTFTACSGIIYNCTWICLHRVASISDKNQKTASVFLSLSIWFLHCV